MLGLGELDDAPGSWMRSDEGFAPGLVLVVLSGHREAQLARLGHRGLEVIDDESDVVRAGSVLAQELGHEAGVLGVKEFEEPAVLGGAEEEEQVAKLRQRFAEHRGCSVALAQKRCGFQGVGGGEGNVVEVDHDKQTNQASSLGACAE